MDGIVVRDSALPHGPFRRVLVCTKCNHVMAWQGLLWWTYWRVAVMAAAVILAVPSFLVSLFVVALADLSDPPKIGVCSRCGDEWVSTRSACWVRTWTWKPWTWGSGFWLLKEDFERIQDGKGAQGGELTIYRGERRAQ